MDNLEMRIVEDIKCELILSKRENQRLSEKLDCLIILLRRAWQGEGDAIHQLSEIVGIPSPKIIPQSQENNENNLLGQEYLHLTSSLLDKQLKEDVAMRNTTKVLRPSSGKRIASSTRRVRSATQRTSTPKASLAEGKNTVPNGISNGTVACKKDKGDLEQSLTHSSKYQTERSADNFTLASLTGILPMFTQMETKDNRPRMNTKEEYASDATESKRLNDSKSALLFDPETVVGQRKVRPVSAALQQRQDYLRHQTDKKKLRPHTAKPAFRHVTDSEYNTIVRTHHGQQSPVSSPENTGDSLFVTPFNNSGAEPPISVNISPKNHIRSRVITAKRNFFPEERDEQALGDVTDALHRVQEMERMFRRNTRRLQQKIGIPDAGCI